MSAQILSGKEISARLYDDLHRKTLELKADHIIPGLAVILVGENPASLSYVTAKSKKAEEIGMYAMTHRLSENISQDDLLEEIQRLNVDPKIHGILVQMPLPKHIDPQAVIETILPSKDVDGFHPINIGKMLLGEDTFLPCTPHGICIMLEQIFSSLAGLHIVVVGRSNIVGKPLANLLIQRDATVTVCHSRTPDIGKFTRDADIVIVAVGKPNILTAHMVKDDAVVIDVGVNRIVDSSKSSGFRLVGDTDFDGLLSKVKAITPVPGGVGPMTIALLMYNTIKSAEQTRL